MADRDRLWEELERLRDRIHATRADVTALRYRLERLEHDRRFVLRLPRLVATIIITCGGVVAALHILHVL